MEAFRNDSETKSFSVHGIAQDDAVTFATGANDIKQRPMTSESAFWQGTERWSGSWYDSPDIRWVIKEVVTRAGWSINNAIGFILYCERVLDGDRSFFSSWEKDPDGTHAAYLIITYRDLALPTISAKANISSGLTQTLTAKASIKVNTTKTITASARILVPANQSISTLARIETTQTQSLNAKSSISNGAIQTINALANIKVSSEQTINAIGRITVASTQSLTAKGRISLVSSQTTTALDVFKLLQNRQSIH